MADSLPKAVEELYETLDTLKELGLDLDQEKPEPLNRLIRRVAKSAGMYPVPNLAVDVCMAVFLKSKEELRKVRFRNPADRVLAHRLAYCTAMPRLSDSDSIRDFIACVTHAMALTIIPGNEGARLLYGAQVAQTALPPKKRHKKHTKSALNAPSNHPTTPTPSTT